MSLRFPSLIPTALPASPPTEGPVPTPKRRRRLLALLMWLLPAAAFAQTAPNSFVPKTKNVIVPQIGACAMDGGGARLDVTQVVARVRLDDDFAHTTLEVTIQNKTDAHEAFELLVPSPRGAAPTGYSGLETAFQAPAAGAVTIQDVLQTGGLPGENARTKTDLETLKGDAAIDAMLMLAQTAKTPWPIEFAGHDLLRTGAFEIAPKGQVTVHVSYDEPLTWLQNEATYTLPRSQAPESIKTPWGLDLLVQAGPAHRIAAVFVPTQDVVVQTQGPRERRVQFVGGRHAEPGPVQVRVLRATTALSGRALYMLERGAVEGAPPTASNEPSKEPPTLSIQDVINTPVANQAQPAGSFILYTGLDPELDLSANTFPREVLFVFDRSGSMKGDKFEQARQAALTILDGLGANETFNLIAYSSQVDSVFKTAQVATDDNRQKARDYLYALDATGSTNIDAAMTRALAQQPKEGYLPIVLFLTDGLPTDGIKDERQLTEKIAAANVHQRRVITFGVGYDVNVGLLDSVAQRSNGSSHYVRPSENVENKIAGVYDGLRTPTLIGPTLTAWTTTGQPLPNALRLVQPRNLPDVYAGGSLTVLGRCTATEPIVLRLSGNFLGEMRSFDFPLDPREPEAGRAFIPDLWASRTIASTVQDIRQPGRTTFPQALADLLLDLSSRYGIIGEYTAFLSLDGTNLWDRDVQRTILRKVMTERAQAIRVGRAAVSQSMNANYGLNQTTLNRLNRYVGPTMQEVTIPSVRQIAGRAFFRRGNTWIDSLLIKGGVAQSIDETVAIGSPRYLELVHQLADQGRVGLLSLPGNLLFADQDRCVYVQP